MSFPDPIEDQENDAPREFRVNSFRDVAHPYDAKSLLSRPPWVFTSPNLSTIPFVEVAPTPLQARADGRFGLEDYVVWPQSYSEAYPWAPCVPRKPQPEELDEHPHWFLWEDLTRSEWVAPPGASWQKTGVLRDILHNILRRGMQEITSRALRSGGDVILPGYVVVAVNSLNATMARLKDLPMSYRDLVLQFTQAQRLALDLLAMNAYHDHLFQRMTQRKKVYPLRSELIGCHTNNPTTVENMFYAGIPVVYVRPSYLTTPSQVRVCNVLQNFGKIPDDIVTAPWPGHPCKILHDGASGTRRLQMSRPCGRYFEDLIALPDIATAAVSMTPFLTADLEAHSSDVPVGTYYDSPHSHGEHEQTNDIGEVMCSPSSPGPSSSGDQPHNSGRRSNRTVFGGGVTKQPAQSSSRKAKKMQHKSARRGHQPTRGLSCQGGPAQVNRNKWLPHPSPLMPPYCQEWMLALRAVNKQALRKSVIPKERTGLMYPDPVFIVSVTPRNRAFTIAAWLSIRPARCGQMLYPSSPQMPVVSSSVWRQFFWIYKREPLSPSSLHPGPFDTGDPSLDDRLDAATQAAQTMFGPEMVASMNKSSREVFWRGMPYEVVNGAVVNMDPNTISEIIWELAELNWRYELLTLDKYAAPHMWIQDDIAGARITAILLVYSPSSSFVLTHAPFPTEDFSVCAQTRAERLPAFTALRRLMSEWPGCPLAIKREVSTYTPSSPDCPESSVIEAQTMNFYCQTFYEYFHRPPVLPCRIP